MDLEFEPDFQKKVLHMKFTSPCVIANKNDLLQWRSLWLVALKSWHSPYKVLLDCSNISIEANETIEGELQNLLSFFKKFFMRSIIGFSSKPNPSHSLFPFEVLDDELEARNRVGLGEKAPKAAHDFRSLLVFENHFRQNLIELSFSAPVLFSDGQNVNILKTKLLNNLTQWHSSWSLLIDCTNLEIAPEANEPLRKMLHFFKGFFLKEVIGYGQPIENSPFPHMRSRHLALSKLNLSPNTQEANCQSRKSPTKM